MENKDSTVVLKWRCENRSSNSITGVILIDNKKKKKKRKMRKRGAEKEGKKGKIKNELTTHGKAIISTPRWARFFFSSLFFFPPFITRARIDTPRSHEGRTDSIYTLAVFRPSNARPIARKQRYRGFIALLRKALNDRADFSRRRSCPRASIHGIVIFREKIIGVCRLHTDNAALANKLVQGFGFESASYVYIYTHTRTHIHIYIFLSFFPNSLDNYSLVTLLFLQRRGSFITRLLFV